MKKVLVLAICMIIGLFILCGCNGNAVYEQTGYLGYEVELEWDSKSVTPAPSTMKQYEYSDYTVTVADLSYYFYEDPLREAMDYVIGGSFGEGASYEGPVELMVADMDAKESTVTCTGQGQMFGIFTAIETKTGTYVIATTSDDPEQETAVRKRHDALKSTVVYSDISDSEVYAKNVLQFGDYICKAPVWDSYIVESPWWSSRIASASGVINYVIGYDISSIKIVPMDSVELTEEVMKENLGYIYNGDIAPLAQCTLSNRKEIDSSVGTAAYYELDVHFGDDMSNTVKASAVFIADEEGQAVACMCNTSDSDLTFDYTSMTTSMQPAAPVYEQVDVIYSLATDYVGDNTSASQLAEAVGFGKYGEYVIELQTSEAPYGMKVSYTSETQITEDADTPIYDFQREAVMMLGMIGNLEYIEIIDADSNVVRYDTSVTKSLLMYDVKKMASDKAVLESYYLDTLLL